MVIYKGWYVKYKNQTNNLLWVICQKYIPTKLQQHKILGQNSFLSLNIKLKTYFKHAFISKSYKFTFQKYDTKFDKNF